MNHSRLGVETWAVAALLALSVSGLQAKGLGDLKARTGEAMASLTDGLREDASHEASSQGGFKAQEALMGRASGVAPVAAETASQGLPAAEPPAIGPKISEAGAPPLPGIVDDKDSGLLSRIRGKVTGTMAAATNALSGMSKAKRVALLTGLIALEVVVILYPLQAVGVTVMGLGALGLVGTTRELIAEFRRRGS